MLEFRLKEMGDAVDFVVLCEATKTHAGHPKPLLFDEQKARFAEWLPKIVHVIDDDPPPGDDAWAREHHQRQALLHGLETLGLADDDWVLISDVDEVFRPEIVDGLRTRPTPEVLSLEMDCFYYSLKWRWREPWDMPRAAPYASVRATGPQALRMAPAASTVENAGWHLSYFGDEAFVRNKLANFAHQEFNTSEDVAKIGQRMREGRNLTDDAFDAVDPEEPGLPTHRLLLEERLRCPLAAPTVEGGPIPATAPAPTAVPVPDVKATVRASVARGPAPRRRKFAIGKSPGG